MIEINLIAKKKSNRLPVVLGVDLNTLNIRLIVATVILGYAGKWYFEYTLEDSLSARQADIAGVTKQIQELEEKMKDSGDLKVQLANFEKQVVRLQERSKVVEMVLSKRANPRAFLERLARNAPKDLWFTQLTIDSNQSIEIKGRSHSYKSIGDFSVLVGESRFLNGRKLDLKSSETVEEKDGEYTRRLESFVLTGKIESY